MKLFILLLAVGIVVAKYKVKVLEDLIKYHDQCGAEHHVHAETLTKFKERDYADDKISHCHVHCLAKKMGLWDDEHGFKVDNVVKQVTADGEKTAAAVKPKVEGCVHEVEQYKGDHCKWAYEGFKCGRKLHLEAVKHEELKTRMRGDCFLCFP